MDRMQAQNYFPWDVRWWCHPLKKKDEKWHTLFHYHLSACLNLTWQVFLHQVTWKLYGILRQLWGTWAEFWYAFFINCSWPRNENKAALPGESFKWKTHLNWMHTSVSYLQILQPLTSHLRWVLALLSGSWKGCILRAVLRGMWNSAGTRREEASILSTCLHNQMSVLGLSK